MHQILLSRYFPVAQVVKILPAIQETQEKWVQYLDWEDPLEEEMATHPSILAWKIPCTEGAWQAIVHGVKKSWTQLSNGAHILKRL